MLNIFKKLFDNEYKELKRFERIANDIESLDEEMSKLSDEELKEYTRRESSNLRTNCGIYRE